MTIQQTVGEIGQWSLQLNPGVPGGLLSNLGSFPLIMVLPTRVPEALAAQTTRPMFRGVLLDRDDVTKLSGADMAWYMGTADSEKAAYQSTGFGPRIVATWASASLTGAMGAITAKNGLGYVIGTGVGGTVTSANVDCTPRHALDRIICPQVGCSWRIRSDGVIELFDPATVTANRVALLTDDPGGQDPAVVSWHVTSAPSRVSDADRRNLEVTRYGVLGFGTVATTATPWGAKTYGGAPLEVAGFSSSKIDSDASPAAISAETRAAGKLDQNQGLTVQIDDPMPTSQTPQPDTFAGSAVGIYVPEANIGDPNAEPVAFRGRFIRPLDVQVTDVVYQFTEGMGVYLDTRWSVPSGGAVRDVSQWVDWEATRSGASTTMTAGVLPRFWDR